MYENRSVFYRIYRFYLDGFREMTVGKWLWTMIIAKYVIFFLVLKVFFFPNLLQRDYDNDADRAQAVRHALVGQSKD